MRKLVVCNIVSLDGYFTGPGDDVMVMPFDLGFDEYNAERLRSASTLLVGRKSLRASGTTGRRSPMTPSGRLSSGRSPG